MASYFNLTLDTTAPAGVTLSINNDDLYTTTPTVNLAIGCSDGDTTGYQMQIWGTATAQSQEQASWVTYQPTTQVTLPSGDGLKTVYVIVRDAVGNQSAQASDSITLDTAVPAVTVTGPDNSTISQVPGFNTSVFNFTSDVIFEEYKVCVVPANGSTQNAGVTIGTTNGSVNTSGSDGSYPADTNIEVTINGTDLEAASSGDGVKIIKVFVKNAAGTWSVA